MQKFGIDISRWQGDFNLAQAKREGVEFAIIKAGGGDAGLYKDGQFENNYNKCKVMGVPCGCYFFSKALNVADAKKEAEYFYNLIKDKKFELPVYFDIENKTQLAVGKAALTQIIHTLCQYMEERGYFVGIYSSASYFKTYMNDNELQRYDHWIASWGTVKPNGCSIWQFGGETNKLRSNKIAGQTVDQNYMYKDYSVIVELGLNGNGKKEDVVIKKTLVDLAVAVLKGQYGNGEDRKKALGEDYEAVQDLVNKYSEIKHKMED